MLVVPGGSYPGGSRSNGQLRFDAADDAVLTMIYDLVNLGMSVTSFEFAPMHELLAHDSTRCASLQGRSGGLVGELLRPLDVNDREQEGRVIRRR